MFVICVGKCPALLHSCVPPSLLLYLSSVDKHAVCCLSLHRYVPGLAAQLRATLLHLMVLAQTGDGVRARDGLSRRADALLEVITAAARDVTAGVASAADAAEIGSGQGSQGDASANHAVLPHDPFGDEAGGDGGKQQPVVDEGTALADVVARVCAALKRGSSSSLDQQQLLVVQTVPKVASVGAAAAGFVRMCDAKASAVKEAQRASAEAARRGAERARGMLLDLL